MNTQHPPSPDHGPTDHDVNGVADEARLTAYVLDELPPEERVAFESKLEADPALRAELSEVRELIDLVRGAMGEETAGDAPTLLPLQRTRILHAAGGVNTAPGLGGGTSSFQWSSLGLGAAAMLALSVTAYFMVIDNSVPYSTAMELDTEVADARDDVMGRAAMSAPAEAETAMSDAFSGSPAPGARRGASVPPPPQDLSDQLMDTRAQDFTDSGLAGRGGIDDRLVMGDADAGPDRARRDRAADEPMVGALRMEVSRQRPRAEVTLLTASLREAAEPLAVVSRIGGDAVTSETIALDSPFEPMWTALRGDTLPDAALLQPAVMGWFGGEVSETLQPIGGGVRAGAWLFPLPWEVDVWAVGVVVHHEHTDSELLPPPPRRGVAERWLIDPQLPVTQLRLWQSTREAILHAAAEHDSAAGRLVIESMRSALDGIAEIHGEPDLAELDQALDRFATQRFDGAPIPVIEALARIADETSMPGGIDVVIVTDALDMNEVREAVAGFNAQRIDAPLRVVALMPLLRQGMTEIDPDQLAVARQPGAASIRQSLQHPAMLAVEIGITLTPGDDVEAIHRIERDRPDSTLPLEDHLVIQPGTQMRRVFLVDALPGTELQGDLVSLRLSADPQGGAREDVLLPLTVIRHNDDAAHASAALAVLGARHLLAGAEETGLLNWTMVIHWAHDAIGDRPATPAELEFIHLLESLRRQAHR